MDQHFLHSTFREKLIEHLLIGELLKVSWASGSCSLEIAKPEVDAQGYDILAEEHGVVRHIQLKAAHHNSRTPSQKLHSALAKKPSGCVVWVYFDEHTLELGPFLFFGGLPGEPLPDISELKVAKHTKANAEGVKAERPAVRVVPKSKFQRLETVPELYTTLFGVSG